MSDIIFNIRSTEASFTNLLNYYVSLLEPVRHMGLFGFIWYYCWELTITPIRCYVISWYISFVGGSLIACVSWTYSLIGCFLARFDWKSVPSHLSSNHFFHNGFNIHTEVHICAGHCPGTSLVLVHTHTDIYIYIYIWTDVWNDKMKPGTG